MQSRVRDDERLLHDVIEVLGVDAEPARRRVHVGSVLSVESLELPVAIGGSHIGVSVGRGDLSEHG